MADYHIMTQAVNKANAQVVFHISVPATGNNLAGLTWRQAVVNSLGGSEAIDSAVGNITPEELTQLKAGELIEISKNVGFKSIHQTNAQRKTTIEEKFGSLCVSVLEEKQIVLEWTGYSGDVA